jgi:hypothetical protein
MAAVSLYGYYGRVGSGSRLLSLLEHEDAAPPPFFVAHDDLDTWS